MRELERRVLLSVLDRKWREHLYEMDYLQEGIGLRAMAQRDPLVEYQREGFDMFIGMIDGDQGGVGRLPVQRRGRADAHARCRAHRGSGGTAARTEGASRCGRARQGNCDDGEGEQQLTYSGPSEDGSAQVQRRNGGEPTPAGVGGGTRRERREAARKQARSAKAARRR